MTPAFHAARWMNSVSRETGGLVAVVVAVAIKLDNV